MPEFERIKKVDESVLYRKSKSRPISGCRAAIKRAFDIILSILGLILSSPIWILVALAIKIEDGGPVLFKQERWGLNGSTKIIYKFRTMIKNASNHQARPEDDRITSIGKLLRATGLDELPQLINILLGDMSLVGPRPLAVDEIIHDSEGKELRYENILGFKKRMSVRPGLTSISTVYRAKDIPPQKKYKYDLYYIDNYSIRLDLWLIIASFWVSIRGKWEERGKKI